MIVLDAAHVLCSSLNAVAMTDSDKTGVAGSSKEIYMLGAVLLQSQPALEGA